LYFNALTGILMSFILAAFSGWILKIVSIAPALLEPAETYLKIVGGASFLNALIPIFFELFKSVWLYKTFLNRDSCW